MTLTNNNTEIWAIGGGKGGTGKTFLVSQMGIYLASNNKRVILVDTDFGGANLHSFLGLKRTKKSIIDFLEKKEPLERLVVETKFKNLGIIPGDFHSLRTGQMIYSQKTKLLRHIRKLDADYILLDLGGGTSNDTIDAFLLADRMIVVAVPEITSIENLYQFVKNAYFRKLKFLLRKHNLKDSVKEIWENKKKHNIKNIVDLIHYIREKSDQTDAIFSEELSQFLLFVVLNKVRNALEIKEGFSIKSVCIKYIGVEALFPGYVEYDFQFWKSLSLIKTSASVNIPYRLRKNIMRVAENIINSDQIKISSLNSV
jgi:flagellar biosynthesis protein FlhG